MTLRTVWVTSSSVCCSQKPLISVALTVDTKVGGNFSIKTCFSYFDNLLTNYKWDLPQTLVVQMASWTLLSTPFHEQGCPFHDEDLSPGSRDLQLSDLRCQRILELIVTVAWVHSTPVAAGKYWFPHHLSCLRLKLGELWRTRWASRPHQSVSCSLAWALYTSIRGYRSRLWPFVVQLSVALSRLAQQRFVNFAFFSLCGIFQ